jgi:ELWxxDGT repeat protein
MDPVMAMEVRPSSFVRALAAIALMSACGDGDGLPGNSAIGETAETSSGPSGLDTGASTDEGSTSAIDSSSSAASSDGDAESDDAIGTDTAIDTHTGTDTGDECRPGEPGCAESCEQLAHMDVSQISDLRGFASLGDAILFWEHVAPAPMSTLWRVDAVGGVATPVVPDTFLHASPLYELDGALYFGGQVIGDDTMSLWRTDGTQYGTVAIDTLPEGELQAAVLGDRLLYRGFGATTGVELSITDGTEAGSTLLFDIAPGTANGDPRGITTIGDTSWLFTGACGDAAVQLWTTDGTPAGTTMLATFDPPAVCAPPSWFGGNLGLVFFREVGPGGALWRSDGTPGGTSVFADGLFYPPAPGLVDGWALLRGPGGFYRTDGTAAGTTLVRAFGSASPIVAFGDVGLVDVIDDGERGLWATDGTADGTTLLELLGDAGMGPHAIVGDRMFAMLGDPLKLGRRLWITDGSYEGTQLVHEWNPFGDNQIGELVAIGDAVYFGIDDGATGNPWRCHAP